MCEDKGKGEILYREFLKGKEEAFDEVVLLYRGSLTLFINRYVNNMDISEDIAADTFVYVYMHKKKYNFKVSLKTYIFMIGKCRALDYIRHNKLLTFTDISDAQNVTADEKTLLDKVIKKENAQTINQAMKKLPADMQAVLYLIYFEELSYEEATKVLGKNKKQIDNLLYRARKLLKEELKKEGIHSYEE